MRGPDRRAWGAVMGRGGGFRNQPAAPCNEGVKETIMADPQQRPDEPIHIDADKARGAEIILTRRRNRVIFIAGLVGFVLLALVLGPLL